MGGGSKLREKVTELEAALLKEREWGSLWLMGATAWQGATDRRLDELKQMLSHPDPLPWPSRNTQETMTIDQVAAAIEAAVKVVGAQAYEAGLMAAADDADVWAKRLTGPEAGIARDMLRAFGSGLRAMLATHAAGEGFMRNVAVVAGEVHR